MDEKYRTCTQWNTETGDVIINKKTGQLYEVSYIPKLRAFPGIDCFIKDKSKETGVCLKDYVN